MSRLDDIKARLAEARPGPWRSMGPDPEDEHSGYWAIVDTEPGGHILPVVGSDVGVIEEADAWFIAHAPTDVAWLVQRVTDLKHKLAEVRDQNATAEARGRREQLRVDLDVVQRSAARTALRQGTASTRHLSSRNRCKGTHQRDPWLSSRGSRLVPREPVKRDPCALFSALNSRGHRQ